MVKPGQTVTFDYTSDGGTLTRRSIDVLSVYRHYGNTYVRGYCHLRREERTFRMDRMRVVGETTGGLSGRQTGVLSPVLAVSNLPASSPLPVDTFPLPENALPFPGIDPPSTGGGGNNGTLQSTTDDKALHRRVFWRIITFMYVLPGVGLYLLFGVVMEEPSDSRRESPSVTPLPAVVRPEPEPEPEPRPAPPEVVRPEPAPQPRPVPARVTPPARTVPSPSPSPPNPSPSPTPPPPSRPADPRAVAFTDYTGIADPVLFSIYRRADSNRDGTLSWNELEAFQRWVYRSFRYRNNATALAPHEFGVAGGGDCEDFALYTCGLLAYWGYECYIGSFAPVKNRAGGVSHAVALLVVSGPEPYDFTIKLRDADPMPPGARGRHVIPIDYDVVGGFTNATPDPWILRAVYEPTEIYGSYM
jgi:hypothetical protein